MSSQQLISYFGAVDNIGDMHYVFNGLKATREEAVNGMQDLMRGNADDIFDSLRDEMKESLGLVGDANSTEGLLELIDNISSPLYIFIRVQ